MRVYTTHTVDENVKKEFIRLCEAKAINMSKWIENKMKEFIKEEGGK